MAEVGAAGGASIGERELVLTRVFDAPRDLVFRAWTEPTRMAQWWGPRGFTNPVCELDVRPGGVWRIVMRGPGGIEVCATGEYREVVAPERLVFTNNAMDMAGNLLLEGLTTVTFADDGGKTRMTLKTRAVGRVPQAPQMLAGMEIGWSQSLDRLGEFVAGV
jgi:uncharacterized protein YndB with AHSA1/START domain